MKNHHLAPANRGGIGICHRQKTGMKSMAMLLFGQNKKKR
jgi:hypothetical protein